MPTRATQLSGTGSPSTPELQISPSRSPIPTTPVRGPNPRDRQTSEGSEDPRDLGSPIPTHNSEAAAAATDLNAEDQTTTCIEVVEAPGNTIAEALADLRILALEQPPVTAEEIEIRRLARRQRDCNTSLGNLGMHLTSMEDLYQDIGVRYHLTTDIARNAALTREARDVLRNAFSGEPRALMPLWDNHRRAVAHHNILRHALKEQIEDEVVYFARVSRLMERAVEEGDTFYGHLQEMKGLVHYIEDIEVEFATSGGHHRLHRAIADARRSEGYLVDLRVHAWVRALPETPRQLALRLPLTEIIQNVFCPDERELVSGSETSDDVSGDDSEDGSEDRSENGSEHQSDSEPGESRIFESS
ncbi:hypothetical protein BU16DRAFT_541664 [Lophium mytilinum]|uniref:Uncharacterized protein n=1 Tax=Lophium mytilinum TaxID=390894 RepID=A0A6A6QLN0_9PEZI|nr:hypothetical protein BU16DRAFT_541664 [Lophium mytilinum]